MVGKKSLTTVIDEDECTIYFLLLSVTLFRCEATDNAGWNKLIAISATVDSQEVGGWGP